MSEIKLGCHVGMAGKEMFLASAKEAASYGANVFMLYTGAPQNTRPLFTASHVNVLFLIGHKDTKKFRD